MKEQRPGLQDWLNNRKRIERTKLLGTLKALEQEGWQKMPQILANITVPESELSDSNKATDDRLAPYKTLLMDAETFPVITAANQAEFKNRGYVAMAPDDGQQVRTLSRRFADAMREINGGGQWKISLDKKEATIPGSGQVLLVRVTGRHNLVAESENENLVAESENENSDDDADESESEE